MSDAFGNRKRKGGKYLHCLFRGDKEEEGRELVLTFGGGGSEGRGDCLGVLGCVC